MSTGSKMETDKVATEKKAKKGRVLPCLRKCLSEGGRRGGVVPVRGQRGMCNAGRGPARRVWPHGCA